jgi:peptide/nickel transport system permease protein
MQRYIVRRLVQTVIVILLASMVIFAGTRLTADPLKLLLDEHATKEEEALVRERLGLDRPIWEQFIRFVIGMTRGDFGESWVYRKPAMELVLERLPASLQLAGGAAALSLVLAIPFGILSGYARASGRWPLLDKLVVIFSLLGISAPTFWVGIFAILIFAVKLNWLPTSGRGTLAHAVMPVCILSFGSLATMVRLARSGMLEAYHEDYIRTARAKGLHERQVLFRHAFKNVMIPVVTVSGMTIGNMLVYATVIETIFAWPGMGRLLQDSMLKLDYPVMVAYGMVVAVVFSILNLVVDLSYVIFDPRIGHE